MADPDLDRSAEDNDGASSRAAARRMAASHRRAERDGVPAERHTSSTASADAVDALRRSVRDLKHDVRMLKVVVDKQSALLEQVLDRLHER